MKIIITGWNGFIGRNVMKKLIDDHECQLIDSDLIDRQSWKNQLDFYVQNTDVILHIGAISDTTLQDSNEMLKYNYIFSKNLFDLAKKYNKKVVVIS